MSNLVYLITSLPSLTFGQVPPISIDEFQSDAQSQLSARHFKILNSVDIQKMNVSVNGMKSIDSLLKGLQYDLSEIRSARAQNRQPKLDRLPTSATTGNPLEREKKIMHWQWEELNTIEAGKIFTLTEVLVYKLKLQIISRLHSFDNEKGAEVLESVVNPSKNKEGK